MVKHKFYKDFNILTQIITGIEEGFSKFVVDNSNITGTFLLDMNIHYPLRVFIYGDEQFNEEYISRCIQRVQ